MNSLGSIQFFLNIDVVVQRLKLIEEDVQILLNLLNVLRSNVAGDVITIFPRVNFKRLTNFLKVTSIPVKES